MSVSEEEWRSWESEWLSPEDCWQGQVTGMCKILGGLESHAGFSFGQRKWRLFLVACLERVRHLFRDERTRGLVDGLEQVAEGVMSYEEYLRLGERANDPPNVDSVGEPETCSVVDKPTACAVAGLSLASASVVDDFEAHNAASWLREALGNDENEERIQAASLRDIFGNPFRRVSVESSCSRWNSGPIPRMAEELYDARAFDEMPILADALEDAGCDDEEILLHCREPGTHVRGCWVLDLLLGKE